MKEARAELEIMVGKKRAKESITKFEADKAIADAASLAAKTTLEGLNTEITKKRQELTEVTAQITAARAALANPAAPEGKQPGPFKKAGT